MPYRSTAGVPATVYAWSHPSDDSRRVESGSQISVKMSWRACDRHASCNTFSSTMGNRGDFSSPRAGRLKVDLCQQFGMYRQLPDDRIIAVVRIVRLPILLIGQIIDLQGDMVTTEIVIGRSVQR